MWSVLAGVAAWGLVWVCTQGIFLAELPLKLPGGVNVVTLVATAWVLVVTIVCLVALPAYRRESLPRSKWLWLYVLPAVLLAFLPQHYVFAPDVWVFMIMIIVTVFWQDYLTFGVLQPFLSRRMSPTWAVVVTTIVFFAGHVVFSPGDIADPQMLLIASAGLVFALSRRFTGAVYLANVIHLSFYLL